MTTTSVAEAAEEGDGINAGYSRDVADSRSLAAGTYHAPAGGLPCPLDRLLRALQPGLTWTRARNAISSGKVTVDGRLITSPETVIRPGQRLTIHLSAPRHRTDALPPACLAFVDRHVVVVHKPAGLSTVPYDSTDQGTLQQILEAQLARNGRDRRLGVVHRLDKETSGLLVFARTLDALRNLKQQFRFHTTRRQYVALAHGEVRASTYRSRLVANRGDGRRGSTTNPRLGKVATTHVVPREQLDSATLLECRLETGRTHQIRIHLAEAGHPLVGERVYGRQDLQPRLVAPRLMLHAELLGFEHPVTGQPMVFESAMPPDMAALVQRLRHC